MTFKHLNLNPKLIQAITEMGYQEPSPIQSQSIPLILDGHDVIGQSQTGSGKTAAFGLPILSDFKPLPNRKTKSLILCPTRELCLQVSNELRKFSKYMESVRVVSVFGGQEINRQIKDIKGGSDIVVATPGRLLDHMRRRTLRFNDLEHVILDEADEMLNMGFLDEINDIFAQLPTQRQTILFSATMPKPIRDLAQTILTNPKEVTIKNKTLTVKEIKQIAYEVMPTQKNELLIQLLELHNFDSALIFCNTKKMVDDLTAALNKQGYLAMALHGDLKQEMRTAVMNRFKNKQVQLLIATDVAARGIDIDQLDVVINYDLPQETEYYVHRIGRTGRAGQDGLAITFFSPRQRHALKSIERMTRQEVEIKPFPTQQELSELTVNLIEKEVLGGLKRSHEKTAYILNELSQQGYSHDQLLFGLLSKVVEAHTLKAIEPMKTVKRKERGEYSTIVMNLGKKHNITPAHLIAGIAESTGISGKEIGKIKIGDRSSTIDIPKHKDQEIIDILSRSKIGGKVPYVQKVKRDRTRRPRRRKKS